MARFYVHYNGAAVFVKDEVFFQQQKRKSPEWNTSAWHGPINAEGIEHARLIGQNLVREGKLTTEGCVTPDANRVWYDH